MQVLQRRNFSESPIYCTKRFIKRGEAYKMHRHDYMEAEMILEGEAEHIYNSERTVLKKGSAYIIPPQALHSFTALSDVILYNICFDIDIAGREITDSLLSSADKNFYCSFATNEAERMIAMAADIEREQTEKKPMSDVISNALITVLCGEIIRRSEAEQRYGSRLLSQAISYVHGNFRAPLQLCELADRFSVTPNYLGHLFLKHTGRNFNSYVNELRLKYACNILRFSSEPICEAAASAGYSSAEYFSYAFKKKMGITPGEYRKTVRQDGSFR